MPPAAYESDERTTASVPATAHQPPSRVDAGEERDAERSRSRRPTICGPRSGSCGRNRSAEEEREDRHRRLGDPGDARVDVRLAPRDERHRHRGVDRRRGRGTGRHARRSCVDRRGCPSALHEVAGQQHSGDREPEVGHRRGRNVLDGDLDEEVRGAPHRREQQDQRPVASASRPRLPRLARHAALRRERPRRAAKLSALSSVTEPALHRALGLTDGEFERIRSLLERDPNDFELAVFSLLWSEHCGYKHSALLLKRLPSTRAARAAGAGRERRRARPRRRPRGRVQGREPQPPVGGRAVPGSGDRSRRDPARHRRDGRAAGRAARRPALRRARLALLACRRRHRPLRQLRRRPDRRRRGGLRRGLPRQLPRERDVRRAAPGRAAHAREGDGRRPARRPLRRDDRTRRDRRRVRAREPGARRRRRRRSARRSRSATRSRGRSSSRRPSSSSPPGSSSRSRTAAPRASRRRSPRWRPTSGSTSTSTASRCARRGWSPGR